MDIHSYVFGKRKFIIDTLKELVAIPSISGKPSENAPFGTECARMLEAVKRLYEQNGFKTKLCREGGWLTAEYGSGENSIGLYAHSDVVPVEDNWLLTSPFELLEKDGFLIGRGVEDNKCAILISIITAMAIRDLNLPFNGKLVMFTGSSEETGMQDMRNFVKTEPMPDVNIVVDNDFPCCCGEKGISRFWAISPRLTDSKLTEIFGGNAMNITLGKVQAVYDGRKIVKEGISKHAAHPEGSLNAATLLFEELCTKTDEKTAKILKEAKGFLETYDGSAFSINSEDPDFGPLTCANGMVRFEDGRLRLSFDVRFGVSADSDKMVENIRETLDKLGWSSEIFRVDPGFIMPKDDKTLLTVLNEWKKYTGKDGEPMLCNGGTYARRLKNAVSIGMQIERDVSQMLPQGHGFAHQPDECINIDGLLEATEIVINIVLKFSSK